MFYGANLTPISEVAQNIKLVKATHEKADDIHVQQMVFIAMTTNQLVNMSIRICVCVLCL